ADAGTVTGVNAGFTDIDNLTGGTGTDAFTLSGGTLSGAITGGGGAGVNTLTGDNVGNTWLVTGAGSGFLTGVADGFSDMDILNGGTIIDTFNIQTSTTPLNINAGTGDDVINISSDAPLNNGNVNSIAALLTINGDGGSDSMNINDSGDIANNAATLTGTQLTGLGMTGGIAYGTIETLNIAIGSGDDIFDIEGTSAVTTLNAGSGDDTLNVGNANSLDSILGALTINGEDYVLGDVLNINDQGDAGTKTYTMTATTVDRTGAAQITYGTVETLMLNSGTGDDTVNLSGGTNDTRINAGAGTDAVNISGSFTVSNEIVITAETIRNPLNSTINANKLTINGAAGVNAIGMSGNPIITSVNTLEINASSGDAFVTESNGIDLSTIDMGGGNFTLTVNTGDIAQSGVLMVGGVTTLDATNITLDNAANNFGTVRIIGDNNVILRDINDVDLSTSTVSGTLNVLAGGAITDSGVLNVTGATTFDAGAGNDITLNNANNFSTVAVTSGNDVWLVDTNAVDLAASTVSGTLLVTAGGAITDSGALNVTGATTVNAPGNNITLDEAANNFGAVAVTSGNNVVFRDVNAIDLGASTVLGTLNVTAGGVITDSGTLNVAGVMTVGAGAGNNITLNEAANDFNTVTVTSGNNVVLLDTNTIDLGASLVFGNLDVTSTGGDITDSGALTVSGTSTFNVPNTNSIIINSAGNALTGAINLPAAFANLTMTDTSAIDLPAVDLTGSLYIASAGAVNLTGAVVAAGGFRSSGTTFDNTNGPVNTSGSPVLISHSGAVTLGTINAGSGAISLSGSTIDGGTFTGSSATINAGTIGLTAKPTADVPSLTLILSSEVADVSGILMRGPALTTPPPAENIIAPGVVIIEGLFTYLPSEQQDIVGALASLSTYFTEQEQLDKLLRASAEAQFFMTPPLELYIEMDEEEEPIYKERDLEQIINELSEINQEMGEIFDFERHDVGAVAEKIGEFYQENKDLFYSEAKEVELIEKVSEFYRENIDLFFYQEKEEDEIIKKLFEMIKRIKKLFD
ncbi:MAG: hypothetical protein JRI99_01040, partial [Deltaproteobacteria bacterium]|nr:hypothetical protein [Deltaproteobacteria bacterium]